MIVESAIKADNKREKITFLQYLITSFLWTEAMHPFLQYFFLLGVNIQYMAILYWGQFEFALNSNYDDILGIIHKICKAITFQTAINPDSTLGVSLALNSVAWGYLFIFLLIFGLIGRNYMLRRELPKRLGVFINLATCFHEMIGFWITNIILMNAIKLAQDSELWSNTLLAINIINLIMIVLNYAVGVLSAVVSYDPLSTMNPLSSHTPVFQTLTFLLKAFLAPVLKIYGDVEFAGWYFAIIAFIMSFSRYAYLLRNYPYYNYLPMRISISFCSAALVSSVASIIALGMKSSISNEPQSIFPIIYIQVMVIPLLSKFGTTYLENSILKFGERKNSSLTSEIDVLKKLFALNYLIKKTSNTQDWSPRVGRSDLQLWGIVASQSQPEEDLAEKFAFENLAQAASLRLLLESMRRMKGNIKLKMIFASHMSNDNSTISAALASLAEIPTNLGISQFIAIKLHRRLQEKLHDLHNVREGILDIRRYVDQTMKKTQFNKLIHNTGAKFADFWDTYRQSDLKVIDLFRKCEMIEIYDKRVKDYWMKHIEPEKSLACSLSLLYSIYLSLIRNAPYTAMKISENHPSFNPNKNLDQETAALSEANFFSTRNMSFTISMSREKLGRVLYMSPNVPEIIGWTKYDLIGHNINRVLPNDMKEQHNLILQKHLHGLTTHTRKPKMYRNLTSHLINKAGQVLPCNTYIAIHPYIQQELVYIGFVKLTSKPRTRTMPASENFADTETSKQFTMVLKKGPPASNEPTNYDILPSYTGVSQGLLPSYDPMESLPTQAQRSKTRNQATLPDPQRTMGRETTLGLPVNGDQSFGYQENAEGGNGDMNFSLGIPDEETRNDRTRTDDDMSYIPDERAIQEKIIISASGYPAGGYSPLLEKKQKEALLSKFSQYGSRTITKDKKEEPSSEYSAKQNLNSLSMHVSAQEKSQKKNIQRIVDLDGSVTGSLTSNRSSAKNYMSKLEQGIYVVPKLPQIRNFRLLVFSLIVVAIALLVFFGLNNTKVLDSIQGNVQVLSESTLRLFRIVDVNRLTRTFALVGLGYMTKDRYNEFAPGIDSRIILLSSFTSSTNQLNTYNNEVRNSLHLIAPSLQQKFYETQIPYNDLVITATGLSIELMGYANMFDLTTILIASADAIIATPIANYDSVTFGNTNVNLIVLNSLNELLVSGEEILTILQQDNDQKFQTEINTFIIVTIIIGVLCCLLFGYFYSLERILLKKRDRIIDIFLRLDEKLLESRTSMVHKFKTSLEKDYFDVRKLDLSFGSATSYPHMSVKKAAAKEMNTGIYKRKRANLLGLNLPVLTMNIYTITLLFMVLLAFLVLLVITIEQSSSVTQKVELMQQSNLNLYNINLAFSIMYEYIYSSKGSTVHNNPITEEWERSYQYISKSQSNFLNLINQDSSVANSEEVNQYLKGNLCELIGGVGIEAQCIAFGGGALTKGIIGGVSIMVSTMSSVIQNYDSSSGSAADIIQVLNNEDLIGLDVIAAAYLFPAFEQIASFIKTRILENIDDATNHFMAIVIVFIVLYIIGGYLLWKKIESMFKRERGGWRRMLRLVPQTVVNNNKMLKDFLLANSDGIMESIKRHLH